MEGLIPHPDQSDLRMEGNEGMDFPISGLRSMEKIASSGLARTASMDLRAWFLKIFSRMSSYGFSFGGASQRLNSAKLSGVAGGGLSSGAWGGGKRAEILPGSTSSLERWFGGAVKHQQDILPGKLSRQDVQEGLEARRIRCRHDQIDASAILRRDRAKQIDVFANEPRGDRLMPIGAPHGRGRLTRAERASSANMIRNRRPRLAAARLAFLTARGKSFF